MTSTQNTRDTKNPTMAAIQTVEIKPGITVFAKLAASETKPQKVGTVDYLQGEHVKMTRHDSADGKDHWIPLDWIERTDLTSAYLNRSAEEFLSDRLNELPRAAKTVKYAS